MRPCFALLLALVAGVSSVLSLETGYYRSNLLGMALERVSTEGSDEFEFVLRVTLKNRVEARSLLQNGTMIKRWEIQYDGVGDKVYELEYRGAALMRDAEFSNGSVTVERSYADDHLIETRTYSYDGEDLVGVAVTDGDEKLLYRERYGRAADGRLRSLMRVYEEGSFVSSYGYRLGRLFQEWHGDDTEGALFRYGSRGRLAEELWVEGEIVQADEFFYDSTSTRSVHTDSRNATTTYRLYDQAGLLLKEETQQDGERVSVESFIYDGDLMSQKTRVSSGLKEVWEYNYRADDGELEQIRYLKNRRVVKVTVYASRSEYYEDIYRNEVPALRVYFLDGQKTREEMISEGSG